AWVFSGEAAANIQGPTPRPVQVVEFVVSEPEPPQEQSEPLPEPEEPEPALIPKPRALQPAALETEVAIAEEAPPELTGSTLLAETGADFAAPSGSGRARRGAFRSGVSRAAAARPTPTAKALTRAVAPPKP